MAAIGFDVYGTLVDPLAISAALEPVVGERATEMAGIWRTKQLEYSFRRALMRSYENFDVCTREALHYAARAVDLRLTDDDVAGLLEAYLDLDPYPDVVPGIESLQTQGHALVAFSNGVETSLRELLSRAGVLDHLDGVVSVDPVQTFKPNPAVYPTLGPPARKPTAGQLAGIEQLLGRHRRAPGGPSRCLAPARPGDDSRSMGDRA